MDEKSLKKKILLLRENMGTELLVLHDTQVSFLIV